MGYWQEPRSICVLRIERAGQICRGLGTAALLSACCTTTSVAQTNDAPNETPLSESHATELACYLGSNSRLRTMLESDPPAVVLVQEEPLTEQLRIPDDCSAESERPSWVRRIEMITPPTAGELYGAEAEHGAIRVVTNDS